MGKKEYYKDAVFRLKNKIFIRAHNGCFSMSRFINNIKNPDKKVESNVVDVVEANVKA